MKANLYGSPGTEPGDQLVYKALSHLEADCIAYAQPKLVYRDEVRYPDYVLVCKDWGVIVLEVKDWVNIRDRDRTHAEVGGRTRPSPVEQARGAAHVLNNMLERDPSLRGYAGSLDFYYAYAGVLPFLPFHIIRWLEEEWGENYLIGKDDLEPRDLLGKLSRINGFRQQQCRMTEAQVRAVCAIIRPTLRVVDHSTQEFQGVYDRVQERIASEKLPTPEGPKPESAQPEVSSFDRLVPSADARVSRLESDMPPDALALRSAPHVRLVRGFAGTGKTDVLILRAHYLHDQYPDLGILVTTFNEPLHDERLVPELVDLKPRVRVRRFYQLCQDIHRQKLGLAVSPQQTSGIVSVMADDNPLIDEFGRKFLSEEFVWMKETDRTSRAAYVENVREGRGSVGGKTLGKRQKEQVLELFEDYQAKLDSLPAIDWVDLANRALRFLQEGTRPEELYDVILIDEAQHFAPGWIEVVKHFLKPAGTLFVCDDPSQGVYRYYSWSSKGVNVVGRSRWLRIPYRCTLEIFLAAYALIRENPLAKRLLAETKDFEPPDLDNAAMRKTGRRPVARPCAMLDEELTYVVNEIATLVEGGHLMREIAVLHDKKHVRDYYRDHVPHGVVVDEPRRRTGCEYKAVFIPQVHQMLDRTVGIPWEEDKAKLQLKFYMTMARARNRLYLLYKEKWPKELKPARPYLDFQRD